MPEILWSDVIGLIGVGVIVATYAYLQVHPDYARALSYSLYNILGSVLIMISLFYAWNLPSFIIEIVWIAVSIFGIYHRSRQKGAPLPDES